MASSLLSRTSSSSSLTAPQLSQGARYSFLDQRQLSPVTLPRCPSRSSRTDGGRILNFSSEKPLNCHPLRPFSVKRNPFVCRADTSVLGESGGGPPEATPGTSQFEKVVETLTTLFPVWVILGTIIGLYKPSAVTWLETDLFTLFLGFLMLSMGLTLTFEDFRRCLRNPWTVGIGFLAQYVVKPLLGFLIALSLKLSAPLATGLILVSCCPGGQASNVATYISKGNVALSVLMTTLHKDDRRQHVPYLLDVTQLRSRH